MSSPPSALSVASSAAPESAPLASKRSRAAGKRSRTCFAKASSASRSRPSLSLNVCDPSSKRARASSSWSEVIHAATLSRVGTWASR